MTAYEKAVREFMQKHEDMQSPEEQDVCRICRDPETPDSGMVSPCRCTGTMGRVHHACLSQWVRTSKSYKCEVCHYQFRYHTERKQVPKRVLASLFLTELGKTLKILKSVLPTCQVLLFLFYCSGILLSVAIVCGIYTAVLCAREGFGPAFSANAELKYLSYFFCPQLLAVPVFFMVLGFSCPIIDMTQPSMINEFGALVCDNWLFSFLDAIILIILRSSEYGVLRSGSLTYVVQGCSAPHVQSADDFPNASTDFTKVPTNPDRETKLYFLPWTNYLPLLLVLFSIGLIVFGIFHSVRHKVNESLSSKTFEDCAEAKDAGRAGARD